MLGLIICAGSGLAVGCAIGALVMSTNRAMKLWTAQRHLENSRAIAAEYARRIDMIVAKDRGGRNPNGTLNHIFKIARGEVR